MDNHYPKIENSINTLSQIGVYRGDYFNLDIDLKDDNNNVIDASKFTGQIAIIDAFMEDIEYLRKTGKIEGNTLKISLSSSDTKKIPIGKYKYVIEIHLPNGEVKIGKGFILIL